MMERLFDDAFCCISYTLKQTIRCNRLYISPPYRLAMHVVVLKAVNIDYRLKAIKIMDP